MLNYFPDVTGFSGWCRFKATHVLAPITRHEAFVSSTRSLLVTGGEHVCHVGGCSDPQEEASRQSSVQVELERQGSLNSQDKGRY